MSELYSVSVLKKTKTSVDFFVQVVHPDSMYIPNSKTFALLLLFDPVRDWQLGKDKKRLTDCPLANEMDINDYLNQEWVVKNAAAFVKSVKRSDIKDRPPKAAERDHEHPYWQGECQWMNGVVKVTVQHPAWIQHLDESLSFETAAYDMGAAKPWRGKSLQPGASADMAPVDQVADTDGMIRLGLEMFSAGYQPKGAPKTVLVPYHGASKYEVVERLEGKDLTLGKLKALMGMPIIYGGSYSEELGTLIKVTKKEVIFFSWSEGSHGTSGESLDSLSYVGRLRFKGSKARLVEKPSSAKAYYYPGNRIEVLSVDDRQIDLRISEREEGAVFQSRSDALALLYHAVEELGGGFGDSSIERSPLARLIMRESELTGNWRDELYSELAGGVIEKVELLYRRDLPPPDFDSMDDQAIVDFFENPSWPGWDVRISVFDAAWLRHLKQGMQYNSPLHEHQAEIPWSGPPRKTSDRLVCLPDSDPLAGFYKQKAPSKQWPNKHFLSPERNDSNYLPYPKYTGKRIKPDLLESLLGEPVVLEWQADGGTKFKELSYLMKFDERELVFINQYETRQKVPMKNLKSIGRARVCRPVWVARGEKAPKPDW